MSKHDPWREVALVLTRRRKGSRGGSYYVLTLECGHIAIRQMRLVHMSQIVCRANMPACRAPKKVRCFMCGKGHARVPVPEYQPGVNGD